MLFPPEFQRETRTGALPGVPSLEQSQMGLLGFLPSPFLLSPGQDGEDQSPFCSGLGNCYIRHHGHTQEER